MRRDLPVFSGTRRPSLFASWLESEDVIHIGVKGNAAQLGQVAETVDVSDATGVKVGVSKSKDTANHRSRVSRHSQGFRGWANDFGSDFGSNLQ
jgi:hypothetical protein